MMYISSATEGWKTDQWSNPENISLLWEYIRYLFQVNMPWIMIVVAISLVAGVVSIIVSMFTEDDEDEVEYM